MELVQLLRLDRFIIFFTITFAIWHTYQQHSITSRYLVLMKPSVNISLVVSVNNSLPISNMRSSNQWHEKHYPPRILTLSLTEQEDIEGAQILIKNRKKKSFKEKNYGEKREYYEPKYRHPPIDDESNCVPIADWQVTPQPTCNSVHEIDLQTRGFLLSSGGWRDAWKISDVFILKTVRLDDGLFDEHVAKRHFVDAKIMEQLTPSEFALNIYGFCAQAALNELAETSLKDLVETSSQKLTNSQGGGVISRLSSLQKLNFAAQLAQGVADLHTIDGENNNVTAVWRDIKPANVLVMNDGSVKINDFNAAELLYWNTRKNTRCTFRRSLFTPNYHSPEEMKEGRLTEKVDIWSLGAIVYYILVEKKPYHGMRRTDIIKAIWLGKKPEIPTELINSTDESVRTLQKVMDLCFTLEKKKRPTARSIANILKSELKAYEHKYEMSL